MDVGNGNLGWMLAAKRYLWHDCADWLLLLLIIKIDV